MNFSRRGMLRLSAAGAGIIAQPAVAAWAAPAGAGGKAVELPRVNGLEAPLALGDEPVHFSWIVGGQGEAARQHAYRILVARDEADLAAGRNLLWDSGRVLSLASTDVVYRGSALPARSRAVWQVHIWRKNGTVVKSAPSFWETGLVARSDWSAQWLASETETAHLDRMAGIHWITGSDQVRVDHNRYYRTAIDSEKEQLAELLLTANELQGIWFNGEPLVAHQDGPVSWTTMSTYPITLKPGRNTIAVAVKRVIHYGSPPPVLATVLRHGAELKERSSSASGWKTSVAEVQGWESADFNDSGWEAAILMTGRVVGEPWPDYPANLLRKNFTLSRPVRSARLYATALGVYEPWLNGARVGDHRLAPEFTDPSRHILYQTYDVTAALRPGANTLGLWIGDGWYGSKFSAGSRFSFGPPPLRVLAQLEVTYDDGSREIVGTGDGWEIAQSPILACSNYDGEIYDARLERPDWAMPAHDSAGWRPAETIETANLPIEPQRCPPIRPKEVLKPRSVKQLKPGVYVVDFGQNFAGWPHLTVKAAAGASIEMRFAELLKADGEVDQANLRTALQRDIYTAAGRGSEVWEPRFTYHGFRYVQVNVTGKVDNWSIEGLVGHQDLRMTGEFRVGDPVIQQFWENSVWSQKSNFYGLPTDCPQRDERLGWMGDAEVFWPAAAFNMDIGAYTARVMEDVRYAQKPNGAFPDVIPPFVPGLELSSPGWADAGIILPYTAWRQYGDTGVIADNWTAMERYLEWILAANPNHLWVKGRGADYGDWLAVDAKQPSDATTPKDLIGTAFWAMDATMMAQMAEAIGDAPAATRYRDLFDAIRTAFNTAYVHADGGVGNESQASYVLAIAADVLSPQARMEAGRRLAADIAKRGNKLSTGFLGTPFILDALAKSGQERVAITLLLQREYPSWGYMVTKGATTMWERWNSDKGDVGMNSRNHYAFGAIGSFLFRRIAGIDAVEAGFGKLRIAPIIDPRLGNAGATYRSAVGTIRTDWTARANKFTLDVELPPNAEAEVVLPDGRKVHAGAGLHRFTGGLKHG